MGTDDVMGTTSRWLPHLSLNVGPHSINRVTHIIACHIEGNKAHLPTHKLHMVSKWKIFH